MTLTDQRPPAHDMTTRVAGTEKHVVDEAFLIMDGEFDGFCGDQVWQAVSLQVDGPGPGVFAVRVLRLRLGRAGEPVDELAPGTGCALKPPQCAALEARVEAKICHASRLLAMSDKVMYARSPTR